VIKVAGRYKAIAVETRYWKPRDDYARDIIKGIKKDVAFKKGHVIREEDVPVLLSIGKENIYIWEKQDGMLHENEAAEN